MDALVFRQYHHRLQISQMFITPTSFSCNLSAATSTLCLRSIISKYFSTSLPKLCTRRTGKIEAISRVSADELKEEWLNSLTCPPLITERENQILQHDEGCRNREVLSSNVDSQFVIGIDPDVSGALAVLKTDDSASSAQVFDSPNVKVLVGNRVRRRLDTKAMVQLLRSLNVPIGTTAYIEQSLPFPADGKQGWWSGGFNYGLWIGVLVASEVSVVPVPSMRWKQEFKLCGNGSTKVQSSGDKGPELGLGIYQKLVQRYPTKDIPEAPLVTTNQRVYVFREPKFENTPLDLNSKLITTEDDSRALACTLFPTLSSSLKRKKDHGRAEALLIAAYGKGIKLDSNSLIPIHTDTTR